MKVNEDLYESIPSLDLADFLSGNEEQKQKFVEDLGKGFSDIGFIALKNHGLSEELQTALYQSIQKFFALEEDIKLKYVVEGLAGQRGYTPKQKEHAKDNPVADLKEFFHVGQPLSKEELGKENYPANIFPEEISEMEETTVQTFRIFEKTGKTLLKAIALYLGLEENYFEEKVHQGNSILRPIHYFPIEKPELLPKNAVRAAAHGDINLITLLMRASAEGLEVLRRDDVWIPITALPEQIIVNVGDMLDRLTNHKLKSTIHRVVNPTPDKLKTSRFSIPFFMHARSEMDLTALESCVDENNPKLYEDTTAGEFLEQRLKEIGLKK